MVAKAFVAVFGYLWYLIIGNSDREGYVESGLALLCLAAVAQIVFSNALTAPTAVLDRCVAGVSAVFFGIPGLHLFLKGLLGVDPVHICLLVPFRVFFYPRWFVASFLLALSFLLVHNYHLNLRRHEADRLNQERRHGLSSNTITRIIDKDPRPSGTGQNTAELQSKGPSESTSSITERHTAGQGRTYGFNYGDTDDAPTLEHFRSSRPAALPLPPIFLPRTHMPTRQIYEDEQLSRKFARTYATYHRRLKRRRVVAPAARAQVFRDSHASRRRARAIDVEKLEVTSAHGGEVRPGSGGPRRRKWKEDAHKGSPAASPALPRELEPVLDEEPPPPAPDNGLPVTEKDMSDAVLVDQDSSFAFSRPSRSSSPAGIADTPCPSGKRAGHL